ncbi:MAG: APC family permease, partial [Planctomycetes bacterium]|nr:APC family permease [Planctomycetota bacterium]
MDDLKAAADGERKLKPYLSPLGAFALALGCAVGQGAFLMPGRVFLPIGGPLGTAIGMLLGAGVMLIIAGNYHYLVNRYPDAGGAFTYAKKILGYDHGFLTAWFLLLAYVAVLWANTTAVPVILRYLVGDFFQVGDYAFAGQKLYLGEVGVALVALLAACLLCMKKSFGAAVQIICALALCVTVALAFVLVFEGRPLAVSSFEPLFSTKIGWGLGILNLVALAPWAFVGFEGISNSAAEFRFDRRKTWRILALAVGVGTALYVMLTLIAISTLPAGCDSWSDYILNLSEPRFQTTNAARPTFFGMFSALGEFGRALFAIGGLGAVLTGIVGNYIAASRLLFAMADDQLLPGWFGRLNRDHAPRNALLFILAVSLFLPFFGRTAISWIVDVTTIGATIVYGYTSAAAWLAARAEGDRRLSLCGFLGVTISASF